MAFKPLHDRVLVRRVESDEKTKGGLIIPESAKNGKIIMLPLEATGLMGSVAGIAEMFKQQDKE